MTPSVHAGLVFCQSPMVLLLWLSPIALAQTCPLSTLGTLPGIIQPCCEAMPDGSCSESFPAVCPQTCASGVVAFWDLCESMVRILPDNVSNFYTFPLPIFHLVFDMIIFNFFFFFLYMILLYIF
eukprot:SAG11_NODE_2843_length_2915_cov_1.455966_4_plen_125_part_00